MENGDIETGRGSIRRKSSGFSRISRISVEDPLLRRHDSAKTDTSGFGHEGRSTQKIYIVAEDLTVVFAGFKTSKIGFAIYIVLCIMTLGLGYLLLRWIPSWKVRLVGSPTQLRDCTWVVIEVRFTHTNTQSLLNILESMGRVHVA